MFSILQKHLVKREKKERKTERFVNHVLDFAKTFGEKIRKREKRERFTSLSLFSLFFLFSPNVFCKIQNMIYKSLFFLSPNVFAKKNIWWEKKREICKSFSLFSYKSLFFLSFSLFSPNVFFAKSKTWFTNLSFFSYKMFFAKTFGKRRRETFVNISLFTKCFCKIQNIIYKSLSPNVFLVASKIMIV